MPHVSEKNLFLMCRELDRNELTDPPPRYHARLCRRDELDRWKDIIMVDTGGAPRSIIDEYFEEWYAPQADLFFQKCLFLCNENDQPVSTCFIWKQYGSYSTVHWLKTLPECEGKGLGRAMLSAVLRDLPEEDFPVYLHTHPICTRALKLYSDLGFELLPMPVIDGRENNLEEALPYLKEVMPKDIFESLRIAEPID